MGSPPLAPQLEDDDPGGGEVQDEPHEAVDEDAPEEGGDKEPSLAFPGTLNGTGGTQYHGNSSDLEEDNDSRIADQDGLTEQTTGEPSLGSFDALVNQEHAWQQRRSPVHYWADAEDDPAELGEPQEYH